MADRPPRRSQRPQRTRSRSFPLVPISIGIVILGFVIGAGLSMLGHRGDARIAAVATAAPRPSIAPATLAPLATPRPLRTDAPEPTVAVREQASVATIVRARPSAHASTPPAVRPRVKATPRPSVATTAPAATASATATATAPAKRLPVAAAAAAPGATAHPRVASASTPVPLRPQTSGAQKAGPPVPAVVTASPAPPAAVAPTIDADSDFGRLSASVVRQYLRALSRGDTASAYGAFGASPGSSSVSFSERPVLDSSAQIGAIQARGSNDAQTVNVTIATGAGAYYATYSVRRTATGAAVIVSHSINKG